jgi:hypothetical protein
MVGVVGMQALDTPGDPADSPLRSGIGSRRNQPIPVLGVAAIGSVERRGESGIGQPLGFEAFHLARRLETSHALDGERTAEPKPGWKGGAIVEERWHLDNHRKAEVTANENLRPGSQRPPDLSGDRRGVVVHPEPSAPVR